MRTTVDIPEALLERTRSVARSRGTTLSEVVVDALRAALSRQTETPSAQPFRLVTFRGCSAWPELDFDRSSELLTGEDEARYRVGEAPLPYRPHKSGSKGRKRSR